MPLSLLARCPRIWRTLKPGTNPVFLRGSAPRGTEKQKSGVCCPLSALGCESMDDISEGILRTEAQLRPSRTPLMPGVDVTRAFDLGQILPHSLWLSCQHLPRPRVAGSNRQGRKSAPLPSPPQAGLPSAPNPNLLDPQAHVPPTGGCKPLTSSVKSLWWVTLFYFLFCVHEFV